MDERDFWAQSSGLTPVASYSVMEHQRAAWKAVLSSPLNNYDDLRYAYLSARTGLSTDSMSMLHEFWASLSGLTPSAKYSTGDHRTAALATNPPVPGGNAPPSTVFGAALTNAIVGTGQARTLYVGDSIMEGEGASSTLNRATAKLMAGIRAKYGIAGSSPGMIGCFHNINLPESVNWKNPLSASSGITPNAWFSTQAKRGADFNAAGYFAQWTVVCDSFDVVHLQGTGDGGSLSISVDGGAATVINTSTGTFLCSRRTHINIGGAPASHTIKVTITAGGAAVDGIVPYVGDYTAGLTWWDCADYGDTSNNFMDSGNPVQPLLNLDDFAPHLIVDNIVGTSDYNNGSITPTTTAANLTSRLNAYNALPTTPTVLLVATYQINSQLTTPNAAGFTMQQYFDACKTAGLAKGAKWLDLNVVYPTFAQQSGWLASDNGHPSNTGHQKIADAMLAAVA